MSEMVKPRNDITVHALVVSGFSAGGGSKTTLPFVVAVIACLSSKISVACIFDIITE